MYVCIPVFMYSMSIIDRKLLDWFPQIFLQRYIISTRRKREKIIPKREEENKIHPLFCKQLVFFLLLQRFKIGSEISLIGFLQHSFDRNYPKIVVHLWFVLTSLNCCCYYNYILRKLFYSFKWFLWLVFFNY